MLKSYQTYTLDLCRQSPSILKGLCDWQTPFMLSPCDDMGEFDKLCDTHGYKLLHEGGMLVIEDKDDRQV